MPLGDFSSDPFRGGGLGSGLRSMRKRKQAADATATVANNEYDPALFTSLKDVPQLTEGEQDSLLKQARRTAMSGLQYVGETLDKPGSAVRGLLAGKPEQLVNLVPFSDTVGLTDPETRVSGRDLGEKLGLLAANKKGFDLGDLAGFGIELATDPLTWVGGGVAKSFTKLGLQKADAAAAAIKAATPSSKVTRAEVLAMDTASMLTPDEIIASVARGERGLVGFGTPSIGIPFGKTFVESKPMGALFSGPKAANYLRAFYYSPLSPTPYVRSVFSAIDGVGGTASPIAQKAADLAYGETQRQKWAYAELGQALDGKSKELQAMYKELTASAKPEDVKSYSDFMRNFLEKKDGLGAADIIGSLKQAGVSPDTDGFAAAVDGFHAFADNLRQLDPQIVNELRSLGADVAELNDNFARHFFRRPDVYGRPGLARSLRRLFKYDNANFEQARNDVWRNIPGATPKINEITKDPAITAVKANKAAAEAAWANVNAGTRATPEWTAASDWLGKLSGGVPFAITSPLRKILNDIGIDAEQIKQLTPQAAIDTVRQYVTQSAPKAGGFTLNVPESLAKIRTPTDQMMYKAATDAGVDYNLLKREASLLQKEKSEAVRAYNDTLHGGMSGETIGMRRGKVRNEKTGRLEPTYRQLIVNAQNAGQDYSTIPAFDELHRSMLEGSPEFFGGMPSHYGGDSASYLFDKIAEGPQKFPRVEELMDEAIERVKQNDAYKGVPPKSAEELRKEYADYLGYTDEDYARGYKFDTRRGAAHQIDTKSKLPPIEDFAEAAAKEQHRWQGAVEVRKLKDGPLAYSKENAKQYLVQKHGLNAWWNYDDMLWKQMKEAGVDFAKDADSLFDFRRSLQDHYNETLGGHWTDPFGEPISGDIMEMTNENFMNELAMREPTLLKTPYMHDEQLNGLVDRLYNMHPEVLKEGLFNRGVVTDMMDYAKEALRMKAGLLSVRNLMLSEGVISKEAGPGLMPLATAWGSKASKFKKAEDAGMGLNSDGLLGLMKRFNGIPDETVLDAGMSAKLLEEATKLYVPQEVVGMTRKFVKAFTDPKEISWSSKLLDAFNAWHKSSLTIPYPMFHSRNGISGALMNWSGDAFSMDSFFAAMKAFKSGVVEDLPDFLDEMKHNNVVSIGAGGTSSQIYDTVGNGSDALGLPGTSMLKHMTGPLGDLVSHPIQSIKEGGLNPFGVRGTINPVEAIKTRGQPGTIFDRAKVEETTNKIFKAGENANDAVEFVNRAAPYIHLRRRGWSPQQAAARVKQLQFNYREASPFERRIARRLIPFYSFLRKNFEQQVRFLFEAPGGKTAQTIRAMNVAREEGPGEKGYVPRYLAESLSFKLPGQDNQATTKFYSQSGLFPIEEALNRYMFRDGLPDLKRTSEKFLAQSHPAIQGPLEKLTGRQFWSGRNLTDLHSMPTGDQNADFWLSKLPTQRAINTVSGAFDSRKPLWMRAVNLGIGGARITDVDVPKQMALEGRDIIQGGLKGKPGVGEFSRLYPKDFSQLDVPTTKNLQMVGILNERLKKLKQAQTGQPAAKPKKPKHLRLGSLSSLR